MGREPGDADASSSEIDDKQHVVRRQASPTPNLYRKEIGRYRCLSLSLSLSMCLQEYGPGHPLAAYRSRLDPMLSFRIRRIVPRPSVCPRLAIAPWMRV